MKHVEREVVGAALGWKGGVEGKGEVQKELG